MGATYTASVAMGWPTEPDALDPAMERGERAQQLDPAFPYPRITRAGVYLNRRQFREAEPAARKALQVAPGESVAQTFLGIALLQQGKLVEAGARSGRLPLPAAAQGRAGSSRGADAIVQPQCYTQAWRRGESRIYLFPRDLRC